MFVIHQFVRYFPVFMKIYSQDFATALDPILRQFNPVQTPCICHSIVFLCVTKEVCHFHVFLLTSFMHFLDMMTPVMFAKNKSYEALIIQFLYSCVTSSLLDKFFTSAVCFDHPQYITLLE
jgi:hypothetical protein